MLNKSCKTGINLTWWWDLVYIYFYIFINLFNLFFYLIFLLFSLTAKFISTAVLCILFFFLLPSKMLSAFLLIPYIFKFSKCHVSPRAIHRPYTSESLWGLINAKPTYRISRISIKKMWDVHLPNLGGPDTPHWAHSLYKSILLILLHLLTPEAGLILSPYCSMAQLLTQ